jgi:hypothetical protein
MKKIFALAFASLLTFAVSAQDQQKKFNDVIKFSEGVHSFGKIKQSVPVTYDFEFTNISKEPIVIEKAQASCGCTTPQWPQGAIMPGKTGKINVGYNAAALSNFEKTITIKVAGIEQAGEIKINGEVLDATAYEAIEKEAHDKAMAQKEKKGKEADALKNTVAKKKTKKSVKTAAKSTTVKN